jgi:hypothetical protein
MIRINDDNPGYGTNLDAYDVLPIYTNKYGSVRYCCPNTTRDFIYNMLTNLNNGIFVEIGVLGGATLLHIHDLCKINNIKIFGIDPWDKINIFNGLTEHEIDKNMKDISLYNFKKFKDNLNKIIDINQLNINIINEDSWNAVTKFEDNTIDVIHIDGDHSYEGFKKDLELYWNKVKLGGTIIVDDYKWSGIKKATNEFIKKYSINIKNIYTLQNNEKLFFNKI